MIITTGKEKSVLQYSEIEISDFFAKISNRVAHFLMKRFQNFSVEINVPDNFIFEADEQQLDKAVMNVLMNAIKFTPDNGNISLSVTTKEENIIISVTDDGIGIDPAYYKSIFEPFSIIHDVLKHKSGTYEFMSYGFGVGLTVTKQVVNMHGGTVEVDSEPDNGSEFRLIIPLK